MLRSTTTILVLCAILTGCATAPEQRIVEKSRTFALTKDQTWEALLGYFTSNNVQIKTIEKDSGVIYAERSRFDAAMADCGQKPLSADLARLATLNVFVRPVDGKTQVTINAQFEVKRTFDNQTWTDPCYSTGLLEREVLDTIARASAS